MFALLSRLRDAMHVLARELVKFGLVGVVAYVVDVTLFNLLLFGEPLDTTAALDERPLTAKAVSVAVATLVAWLGNRFWTFRRRRRASKRRELALFVVMNLAGMAIALLCLWISHYVLELDSPLADNISANVVGLALGTAFRFFAYRTWVFTADRAERQATQHPPLTPS
ncbi:MAG TPA: GtrA family protein [Actinomycetales bacterium]|nr:GtrA family protein [Actinomycetales bacterium]